MSFAHFQGHSSPLFKDLSILKFEGMIKMNDILFTHNTLKKTPLLFSENILILKVCINSIA